ncbi:uncharacterized protein KY384_002775 [Bacidia gigantensis]|uniref:uncharacterized protein n=1 Tax=Bacidia gigantensis TaxID=2732470 RepID=UPI001D03D78F|nr:uncharacterized protein KY384_002775 [Bacidia gigantensis]KAG8532897.1 hypothetical protein KY384_002775 [Bacidia gigantensis]
MILRSRSALRSFEQAQAATSLLPDFLVPALATPKGHRPFSSTCPFSSRVGGEPLSLPEEVNLRIIQPPATTKILTRRAAPMTMVEIEGPLGKASHPLKPYMTLNIDEAKRRALLKIADRTERKQREMWGLWTQPVRWSLQLIGLGTTRSYIQNYILGVSEGHAAVLRLVGVGYRATMESVESSAVTIKPEYPGQQFVSLKVGFNHPIELPVPLGMKATVPQPTRILLEGCDKEVVNEFAAKIRRWRVPEPYKGKGIFVNGETIKLKAKKIK